MKSLNQIYCQSYCVKLLCVKLLSKFQSDPCNHVQVISSPRLKKVVLRKTRLKFEALSLVMEPFKKNFLL